MPGKRQFGIWAAVVLFLLVLGGAIFVAKTYFWSSGSEDVPASADNSTAPGTASGPQIQVGIFLSEFTATGPRRQVAPYGYQTQLRAMKSMHDPSIRLVPVVEPGTVHNPQLQRILTQYFADETPIDVTDDNAMQTLDVLSVTSAADLQDDAVRAITRHVRDGMGLLQRQPGYLVPGYNAQTNALCGFRDGVFGWSASPVECEVVGNHPLLGDFSGQVGKTITLVPNGTVGHLIGIPLIRVKQMRDVKLVLPGRTVGTGEYLYPLYISQLGKGRIVGIGFTQGQAVPKELEAAHHGRFYIHCLQWLAGKGLS